MAVLTGYLSSDGITITDNANLSNDLYQLVFNPAPTEYYGALAENYGSLITNYPVSTTPISLTGVSHLGGNYFYDYYFRVHSSIYEIDAGNLISAKTYTINIWNSYLVPKLLNSIDTSGMSGITVTEPTPAPTYYSSLEEKTYTINISTQGSSIIDASVIFNFIDANDPALTIIGNRIVIIPFKPLMGVKEKLAWNTDIIQSVNGEQRMALIMAARQSFDYSFHLDDQEFSILKAIAYAWNYRLFAIPVWTERTQVAQVLSGATEIVFDTSNADYRANGLVAVIAENNDVEAVEIVSVLSNKVTLSLPFPRTMTNVYVTPIRFANTLDGFNFNREPKGNTFANATFSVTDNVDLSSAGTYPQYKSLDVIHECIGLFTSINEKITRAIDVFDNGSGKITIDTQTNYNGRLYTFTMTAYNKQELWKNRQFLHRMKGKRGAFWRPSFNKDMLLLNTITSIASTMVIQSINYALYYGVTDIVVELLNGNYYYNRILSSVKSGNTDILTLEAAFGVEIQPANVKRISFLAKIRFDSDTVDIEYLPNNVVRLATTVREIPA